MKTSIMTKTICWIMLICFGLVNQGMATLTTSLSNREASDVETEVFHEILAQNEPFEVKPLLNRKHKKSANALKVYSDYVDEGIEAASIETVISSVIQDKANELGNDPEAIFKWVKFNIKNEFHYGCMKSAEKMLIDMAGSPWEQARLLSALLEASNLSTMYKEGNVTMSIESLMSWTGGETPEVAISILRDNGTPTSVTYRSGVPVKITFGHSWIIALLGRKWIPMDPSIKDYEKIDGTCTYTIGENVVDNAITNMVTESGTDGTFSISLNGVDDVLDSITTNLITAYGESTTTNEMFGERVIVVKEWSRREGYILKRVSGYKKGIEHAVIPEHVKFKVKIQFLDYNKNPYGASHVAPLSEIADKKITIKHVPNTDADATIIETAGNIYNVWPAYNVKMKPELRIDDVTMFTGDSKKLGSTLQWVKTSILDPAVGYYSGTAKLIESGSSYSIVPSQQEASAEEIKTLCSQLENDIEAVDSDIDKLYDDALHITGKLFHLLSGAFIIPTTKRLNIVNTSHISIAYVCDELEPVDYVDYGSSGYEKVNRGGVHLDVVRRVNYPVSVTGNADDEFTWMQMSGTTGSSAENAAIELMYDDGERKGAVSTSRIFHETAVQNGAVHVFGDRTVTTREEDCATLVAMNADAVVKSHILSHIDYPYADYDVVVPVVETDTLGYWKGQGWRIVNRDTGESSMMIYGNLREQVPVLNEGMSDSAILNGAMLVYPKEKDNETENEALIALLKGAKTVWAAMDSEVIAGSMILAGGTKMVAATILMEEAAGTAAIIAAAPFAIAGQALGMALIAAGVVTFVLLINNYVMAFVIPRRNKYAYV